MGSKNAANFDKRNLYKPFPFRIGNVLIVRPLVGTLSGSGD